LRWVKPDLGGTIGKTDKSVSGGDEAPQPNQSKREHRAASWPSGHDVSGRWRWTADCPDGRWTGEFDLSETPAGQFGGSFTGDSSAITDGHVHNGSVSFMRRMVLGITQHWVGHFTSGHMTGSLADSRGPNNTCQWQASR